MWRQGKWKKKGRTISGRWWYNWAADRFHVVLYQKDSVTGRYKELVVCGEKPNFNGWVLQ